MISISAAITVVIYLIVGGLIFGLFWFLIGFCESRFPGVPAVWNVCRVVLVILAVLVLVGILLSLISGQPLFRP